MKLFRRASIGLVGLLILLVPSSLLRSDAIVVTMAMTAPTIAEIFVEEDSVSVELEIGVSDLVVPGSVHVLYSITRPESVRSLWLHLVHLFGAWKLTDLQLIQEQRI